VARHLCGQVREGGARGKLLHRVIISYSEMKTPHVTAYGGQAFHKYLHTNSLLTGYFLDDRGSFLRKSKGFCLATESIPVLRRTKSCSGGSPKVQLQAREAGKSPTRRAKDSIRLVVVSG
jgi:hypothetical protein